MDSNNEGPKIGTEEYDRAMVEKYRNQGKPEPFDMGNGRLGIAEVVPHGAADPYGSAAGRMGLSIRTDSDLGPEFGRGRIDPGQLIDMRAEIDRLYEQLRASVGHDPKTGDPIAQIQGPGRDARVRRLVMLEAQLPLLEAAIARQQEADADPDAEPRPGSLESLIAQKQRRDDIQARAEQIAFEKEAEAQAEKIMAANAAKARNR
jgi:hypothetical protein